MASLDDMILDPLENAFDAVGAMQGEFAPLKRAAIGAAIGAGIAYGLKPAFAFDQTSGEPLPFALGSDAANSTYFPYWAIIGLPAFVFSVLI